MTEQLRGPFEKFVDLQCVAVMHPSAYLYYIIMSVSATDVMIF